MNRAHRRNAFRHWLIRLVIWLVPLSAAWWWLGAAEWSLHILRPVANGLLPHVFAQGVSELVQQGDGAWKVRTGLVAIGTVPPQNAVMSLPLTELLRTVMGFPLTWALLLATPGSRLKRLVLGTLLIGAVSLLGIAAHIWASLAVMVNHRASIIDSGMVPPPFLVSGEPFPEWAFQVSGFAHYLAALITPIVAPVIIWLALCPRGVMRLVASLRRRRMGPERNERGPTRV